MKFSYIFTFAFLAFCSCGKKDEKKIAVETPPVVTKPEANSVSDFKDKSNEEILAMKYDKITLKCDLWTQYAKEFDLKLFPNDSFEVDFLNDLSLQKPLMNLKGITAGRTINVDIKLVSYKLYEKLNYKNSYGKVTNAQFSPVLKLANAFSSSVVEQLGSIKGTSGGDDVYENNETDLIKQSIQNANEDLKYFDYLKCSLNSVVKSKYKDQLSSIGKN